MKFVLSVILAALLAAPALAENGVAEEGAALVAPFDPATPLSAADVKLADFLWIARPVVVFADNPADPSYIKQMENIAARTGELAERDVVVIIDTDPAAASDLRLKLRPRGFMLALIGKDGQIELRKPAPWDVRELSRAIDKMPLRQQEMRER